MFTVCARNLTVKTHNEVTPFYRHFEPSETFGTDSHQVRNTITGLVWLTHAQTFFRGVVLYKHRCILSAHARESFRAIANGGLVRRL